jgi:SHS2 domain-containing protein
MTDAKIEAYGNDFSQAFENAGHAVESLMVDIGSVRKVESKEIELGANDLGSLLYQWIESLISLQDSEGLLFSEFKCEVSKTSTGSFILLAKLSGEKFDPERHEQKTAIKAPTFHQMKISEDENRVTMTFVVDL